jgi:hypothetical protein
MSKISFALAALLTVGLPLSSQSFAAQISARREIGAALDFEVPSLHVSGTLIAAAGHRLVALTMALGDEPIETEVRRFTLVTSDGRYEPIGAGASAQSLIPLDRIPLNKEVGVILPSDAIVALTRASATSVMLEVGPGGTVAFLYEVPKDAAIRALRMPDGRELSTTP